MSNSRVESHSRAELRNKIISAATLPDDAAAVVTAAVQVLNPAGWEVKDGNAVIDTQVNAMWDGMVKSVGDRKSVV